MELTSDAGEPGGGGTVRKASERLPGAHPQDARRPVDTFFSAVALPTLWWDPRLRSMTMG